MIFGELGRCRSTADEGRLEGKDGKSKLDYLLGNHLGNHFFGRPHVPSRFRFLAGSPTTRRSGAMTSIDTAPPAYPNRECTCTYLVYLICTNYAMV